MATKYDINPFTGKFDKVIDPTEAINHADLGDMPDALGTNTDHDARYLTLDQTSPQTVSGGSPIFADGIELGVSGLTIGIAGITYDEGLDGFVFASNLLPSTDGEVGLGTANFRWKDLYLSGQAYINGDVTAPDFVSTRSGTITRTDGLISQVALTGGRTLDITRDASDYISSITDGTRTWTFTRNGSNQITSWAVA